jgi:hypothetical protein
MDRALFGALFLDFSLNGEFEQILTISTSAYAPLRNFTPQKREIRLRV